MAIKALAVVLAWALPGFSSSGPYGSDALPYLHSRSSLIVRVKAITRTEKRQEFCTAYTIEGDKPFKGELTGPVVVVTHQSADSNPKVAVDDVLFLDKITDPRPGAGLKAGEFVALGWAGGFVKYSPTISDSIEAYVASDKQADREAWAVKYLDSRDAFLSRSAVLELERVEEGKLSETSVKAASAFLRSGKSSWRDRPVLARALVIARNPSALEALSTYATDKNLSDFDRQFVVYGMAETPEGLVLVTRWAAGETPDRELQELSAAVVKHMKTRPPKWTKLVEKDLEERLASKDEAVQLEAIKDSTRYLASGPPQNMLGDLARNAGASMRIREAALEAMKEWNGCCYYYLSVVSDASVPEALRERALRGIAEDKAVDSARGVLKSLAEKLETPEWRRRAQDALDKL